MTFGAKEQLALAGQAGNFLAGVLFTDMPPAAAKANASLVTLTAQADLLAKALARAAREATLLSAQVGPGGQAGPVTQPGNF